MPTNTKYCKMINCMKLIRGFWRRMVGSTFITMTVKGFFSQSLTPSVFQWFHPSLIRQPSFQNGWYDV